MLFFWCVFKIYTLVLNFDILKYIIEIKISTFEETTNDSTKKKVDNLDFSLKPTFDRIKHSKVKFGEQKDAKSYYSVHKFRKLE